MSSWLSGPSVDDRIAQRNYDKAVEILDARLEVVEEFAKKRAGSERERLARVTG